MRRLTGLSCKGHANRVRRGEAGNAKPLKRAEGLRGEGKFICGIYLRVLHGMHECSKYVRLIRVPPPFSPLYSVYELVFIFPSFILKNSYDYHNYHHCISGVPPIMPIKTPNNKNQKRQNRPSEIRLSGVPPIMPIKTPNSALRASP